MKLKRVVVTGMGAITPIGNNVNDYWEALKSGVSGSDFIKHFDTSKSKTKFACEVKDFNPEDYLDRKEVRKLDLYCVYALVAAAEAIKNSGLNIEAIDKDRAGVIYTSGIGGIDTFEKEIRAYATGDGTPRFSPFFIPKMISDIAAGHISIKYGFRGPNFATVSACASSSNAIIDAFNYIRLGMANIFICGGSEAAITAPGMGGFNSMQAISKRNDDPTTASRPFDGERDGFVMGEGGGALILEEYEHAKARGANIFAEIVGGGLTADAYHITAPHPEGIGATRVMEFALEDAGLKITDVDYVNVHGTSTPLNDLSEAIAIKKVFGDHINKLNISSTKSMTGHLLGAAGAIEAIASILTIKHGIVPPTINFTTKDPDIDYNINFTFNKAQKREVNVAISNTFGFGGHNTCVVIKKYSE
jgi:3-oxoacyl-[acyl-carrier-protein] synthase II